MRLTAVAVKVWLMVMAVLDEKQMVATLVMRFIVVVVEVRLMLVEMRLAEAVDMEVILMVAVVETRLKVVILKMRLMVVAVEVR